MSNEKSSRADALAQKIKSALDGKASGKVRVNASLTGSAADGWRGLEEAALGLKLDQSSLLALLVEHGSITLRAALKKVPRG